MSDSITLTFNISVSLPRETLNKLAACNQPGELLTQFLQLTSATSHVCSPSPCGAVGSTGATNPEDVLALSELKRKEEREAARAKAARMSEAANAQRQTDELRAVERELKEVTQEIQKVKQTYSAVVEKYNRKQESVNALKKEWKQAQANLDKNFSPAEAVRARDLCDRIIASSDALLTLQYEKESIQLKMLEMESMTRSLQARLKMTKLDFNTIKEMTSGDSCAAPIQLDQELMQFVMQALSSNEAKQCPADVLSLLMGKQ